MRRKGFILTYASEVQAKSSVRIALPGKSEQTVREKQEGAGVHTPVT